MKIVLHRKSINGVREIQVFNVTENHAVIYSTWIEGEHRAILENANTLALEQAEAIQQASINSDWFIQE